MGYSTSSRYSATLPQGITLERTQVCLNALKVICHGWRSPPRSPCVIFKPIGRWVFP